MRPPAGRGILLPLVLWCGSIPGYPAFSARGSYSGAGLARGFRGATRPPTPRALNPLTTTRMDAGATPGINCPAFLLDFDGTLCDSVTDTTQAAFSAATGLWPDEMEAALVLDPRDAGVRKSWVGGDWSKYDKDKRISEDIPRWFEEKLRQLRPVLAKGSDAVLAARLIVTDAVNAKASSLGERPLAAGEIVENWDVLRESMLYRVQHQPSELEKQYEDSRPDMHMDAQHWLQRNPLFPGVASSLAQSSVAFYVITRRDVAFTQRVLDVAGIAIPAERIIFAENGRTKADVLVEVAGTLGVGVEDGISSLVYVDDDVNVVQELVSDLRLVGKVRVLFAEWGYSSPSQKAKAARFPRVTTIRALQEAFVGAEPPPPAGFRQTPL